MPQPRKQLLIDTAYRLFNEHGYHATGIDWVLAESGVSKATLYKYFRSKEELILAVLQQRHEQQIALIQRTLEQASEKGEPPALAIFDALDNWFRSEGFFGCNFINASAEYAQEGDAIYQFAAGHKAQVQQLIENSLSTGGEDKTHLAAQLSLLVDGAIVYAHTRGDKNAANLAKKMAARLLAGKQTSEIPQ
ncbi:TetR/AcrR family transcriptional regulator [Marinobacter sp. DUT-3]|uniref:TetR/AcrR family transcriptional regulator n=1 Tax=Marinobacter sp. DUT-3 TaxID=3412036 RepID=UPI003D186EDC